MVKVHSVHKKWTIRSEADEIKLVTVLVGLFSSRENALTKKRRLEEKFVHHCTFEATLQPCPR